MFQENKPYAVYPNVEVVELRLLGEKRSKAVAVEFQGGEALVFDDDLYDSVQVGQEISFRANLKGKYLRNVELMTSEPTRTSTRKPRKESLV